MRITVRIGSGCGGVMREIGSYYYLTEDEIRRLLEDESTRVWTSDEAQDMRLFSLGRDALGFCLDDIGRDGGTALLPSVTDKSLVAPLEERGYRLVFYPVEEDFTVKTSTWNRLIEESSVDIVVFHAFFGFDTIIRDEPPRTEGVTYIYDGTHGWRGGLSYDFADYAFCSLRYWGPLPDGAFASKRDEPFTSEMPKEQDEELICLMLDAYRAKARYLAQGEGKRTDVIKAFDKAAEHIQNRQGTYRISDVSMRLLYIWGQDHWREARAIQRRVNHRYLYEHADWSLIGPPVFEIQDEVPMFFPVMVTRGTRSFWHRELVKHDIYCTRIGPKPKAVPLGAGMKAAASIYDHCLCFPIDQRYSAEAMHRIVSTIQEIGFSMQSM